MLDKKLSLLEEEDLIKKRKNERFAYILGIFTQLVWTINGLQLKDIQLKYRNTFSVNSVIFWRCVPVVISSYLVCYYKKIKITPHKEIKHLIWFYNRSLGNYFFVLLNVKILRYFRLSTSRVFLSCQPLVTIFLSIIFLSEKFHFRYLIGILIGLIGSSMIALNDKKPQSKVTVLEDNMIEGLILAFFLLTVSAVSSVGQKMITKDGMHVQVQNFYLGVYNGVPGLIMCIIQLHFGFDDINYILYCLFNGIVFLAGHYLTSICYLYIDISKFLPVTYLVVVFTFILSVIILEEPIFFTDIVGACLIIGFQFYNLTYPPKKGEEHENNYKNKFIEKMNDNDNDNNTNIDNERHSSITIINRISLESK